MRTLRNAIAFMLFISVLCFGLALAQWANNSFGDGGAASGSFSLVVVEPGEPTVPLYPGLTGDVAVRLTNNNTFPAVITSFTGNGDVYSLDAQCEADGHEVAFSDQTGSWTIPAGGSIKVILDDAVAMGEGAADSCQGAEFRIPLTVDGAVLEPTTTTTAPPTTTTAPPTTTTTVPGSFPDIPSNFNVATYLRNASIPVDTSPEPSGNFRTLCRPSHLDWADPIVSPGEPSSHLHLFFGNDAVDQDSTYTSLRTEGGSTCEGGPLNRTGYWMPAVFDGDGNVVPPELILVYYKSTTGGGTYNQQVDFITAVDEFPNGLRMIAGSLNGDGQHMQWKCGDDSSKGNTIPNDCPGDYVIAVVTFPQCWDGVNLDSPNHRDHMAYKRFVGPIHQCPASHPVHVPEVTENFHWTDSQGDEGTWYLASDVAGMITPEPRGSTLHADWFGAWDNPVQTRWVENCLRGMRGSDNGNLCDGQTLSGSRWGVVQNSTFRIPGWTAEPTG